jgi:hypothetical protein
MATIQAGTAKVSDAARPGILAHYRMLVIAFVALAIACLGSQGLHREF